MSKAALEMITFTYAAECNGTQVKVNVLDPGPVRTIMRAKAMPGEDPATLPRPEELTPMILEALSSANDRHGELIKFRK
jgi:NAD(P)-dependent dehydrogenase (short-subunit alcohol dehydrogenase family)